MSSFSVQLKCFRNFLLKNNQDLSIERLIKSVLNIKSVCFCGALLNYVMFNPLCYCSFTSFTNVYSSDSQPLIDRKVNGGKKYTISLDLKLFIYNKLPLFVSLTGRTIKYVSTRWQQIDIKDAESRREE